MPAQQCLLRCLIRKNIATLIKQCQQETLTTTLQAASHLYSKCGFEVDEHEAPNDGSGSKTGIYWQACQCTVQNQQHCMIRREGKDSMFTWCAVQVD